MCAKRIHASALSIVFSQSLTSHRGPGKGAFDNPTPRQYLEAIRRVRTLYDLDRAPDLKHESLGRCLSLWSNAKSDIGCFRLKAGCFRACRVKLNSPDRLNALCFTNAASTCLVNTSIRSNPTRSSPAPDVDQRIAQLWPCIATIRKDMAWFRGFMPEFPKHAHGPVTILNVGGMNTERQQIAAGIDHDVALAALDLLAGIVSGNGRVFRCFHALTVDHACCGAAVATDRLGAPWLPAFG